MRLTDTQRIDRLVIVVTVLTFIVVILVASAALSGCALNENQHLERIAYHKCGPDGTVDWDDNPSDPPPHCNRDGWNGQRYVDEASERNAR